MNDDKKIILKYIRDSLVDVFVSLARILFFWLPGGDTAKGQALMACHPLFIAFTIALFFILPKKHPLRFGVAIISIIVVASQWLLGGCVITRAEQRLTGEKDTILDPFLKLAGLNVNRDTRIASTIAVGTAISVILLWSVACDVFIN